MSTEDDKILMDHMKETVPITAWAAARQLEAAYELMKTRPGNDEFKLRHVLAIAWNAGASHMKRHPSSLRELKEMASSLDKVADKLRDIVREVN